MPRRLVLVTALSAAALCLASPAQASDTCQRSTGGKCKVGQTAPPRKGNSGATTHKATRSPPKGNHKGRDEYTAAEREKMMERARAICSKEFGKPSRVYRIDYKQNRVWCMPASY
jgi:hypothetical protein